MTTNFTEGVQRADDDTDDKVRGGRWAESFAVLEHTVTATAELTDVVASKHEESTGRAADDHTCEHSGAHTGVLEA